MNNEYIIINKTAIQQRIEELHKLCVEGEYPLSAFNVDLEHLLSQSTPLIPEIEKAFDSSWFKAHGVMANKEKEKQEYIANLKLDI